VFVGIVNVVELALVTVQAAGVPEVVAQAQTSVKVALPPV
jgi:hypothetical protein